MENKHLPPETLNIRPGDGQSQLDLLEEMRGRVPLLDGWYALAGKKALAWAPTAAEADDFFDLPGMTEAGAMRHFVDKAGRKPSITEFERLRKQYYAPKP